MPTSTPELVADLCTALISSLENVCTEACSNSSYDCPDAPLKREENFLDATLPGMIAFDTADDNAADPIINTISDDNAESDTEETPQNDEITHSTTEENTTPANKETLTRSRINLPEEVLPVKFNSFVNIPNDVATDSPKDPSIKDETEVKVGATTSESNSGGVSKSSIGIIVAGMILVVAGITIKKNWSSIRKRFSSTPRSPERPGANANGTAPEEVPLQEKNPV